MQTDLAFTKCSFGTYGFSMELFAHVTLGAKGHQVKVCSWAAGDITDGIKNGLGIRQKGKKREGKGQEGTISDPPCGDGSLYTRPILQVPTFIKVQNSWGLDQTQPSGSPCARSSSSRVSLAKTTTTLGESLLYPNQTLLHP